MEEIKKLSIMGMESSEHEDSSEKDVLIQIFSSLACTNIALIGIGSMIERILDNQSLITPKSEN